MYHLGMPGLGEEVKMSKFTMWWGLKGKEKTKKIIGKTCIVILIAMVISMIVAMIHEAGWSIAQTLWCTLGVILFVLIVLGAIFWGDKK